jgi:hypothetical protein
MQVLFGKKDIVFWLKVQHIKISMLDKKENLARRKTWLRRSLKELNLT